MGFFGGKSAREIMAQGAKSEADLKVLIAEAAKHGALHCKLFFDAHGLDKQTVENALVEFVTRLSKEKGVLTARSQIERSMEHSDMYSASANVEIVVESFNSLVLIAIKYAPIGMEMIEPKNNVSLSGSQAQNIVMDVSSAIQTYTNFIKDKTMTDEERAQLSEQLKRKAEFGAKLREQNRNATVKTAENELGMQKAS